MLHAVCAPVSGMLTATQPRRFMFPRAPSKWCKRTRWSNHHLPSSHRRFSSHPAPHQGPVCPLSRAASLVRPVPLSSRSLLGPLSRALAPFMPPHSRSFSSTLSKCAHTPPGGATGTGRYDSSTTNATVSQHNTAFVY